MQPPLLPRSLEETPGEPPTPHQLHEYRAKQAKLDAKHAREVARQENPVVENASNVVVEDASNVGVEDA